MTAVRVLARGGFVIISPLLLLTQLRCTGVCNGRNRDKGCGGVCFSKLRPDCNGLCGGKAVVDSCGVCDGKNKDRGCDGRCFSGAIITPCGCRIPGATATCGACGCLPPA
jgi:hypothetical protein